MKEEEEEVVRQLTLSAPLVLIYHSLVFSSLFMKLG